MNLNVTEASGGAPTILVVDDEPGLRRILEMRLKRQGYQVLTAENGAVAFDVVRAEKVDLVLSDVRMPDGDGVELLENLSQDGESIPPVILMTGFSDISREQAITMGARAVFDKPLKSKEVIQFIGEVLSEKS